MTERTPIEQLKWDIQYYTNTRDRAEAMRKTYQLALDMILSAEPGECGCEEIANINEERQESEA